MLKFDISKVIKIKRLIVKCISSFFFMGYFPYFAGSITSFFSLGLIWLLRHSIIVYLGVTFLIVVLGFIVSTYAEKIFGKKDSQKIVIDEVAGIFLSLVGVPLGFKSLILGFVIFRILDAVKIYPASVFEKFSGAKGVMLDDLIASLYTNIILQLVFRVFT